MDHDSGTPAVFSKEMYQTKFDAGTYLGYCYQPAQSPEQSDNWRFVKFVLSNLSRTFSSGSRSLSHFDKEKENHYIGADGMA